MSPIRRIVEVPFRRGVRVCSAVTAAIGLSGFLGWITAHPILASFGSQFIPMAPLTAGAFMLLGVSLFLEAGPALKPHGRSLLVGSAVLVSLISLLNLIQFFTGIHWGIEEALVRHPATFGAVAVGRLSPITAAFFLLDSVAVLALLRTRTTPLAAGLTFFVLFADTIVLLGYLYGSPLLYGGTIIPMALTTCLAFSCLNVSLLAAAGPDHFPLRSFYGPSTRALLLRTFLPVSGVTIVVDGLFHHFFPLSWNPALLSALSGLIAAVGVGAMVSKVAGTVGGAIDRSEEHVELELQRLHSLRIIDKAITTSVHLNTTLCALLDVVTAQLAVHAVSFLLLDPKTQKLRYALGRGFHSPAITGYQGCLGEKVADQVALERRMLNIPDLRAALPQVPGASEVIEEEGFISYYGVPLIAKGQLNGVLEIFHRAPLNPDTEWLDFLETLAGQAAIAIDNATLVEDLKRANADLNLAYDTTLEGWSRALDLRDHGTEGHSLRVAAMTLRLARAMGLSEMDLVHVRRGALLHDIGKMGIPDRVLLKPGPLTPEEWDIMRLHPVYAHQMLSPIAYLGPALDIPFCHHEQWNGKGYPRGLQGEQIPLAVRIFSIVDIWDALVSERPYHPAWPKEKVRDHLRSLAGTQLDPHVVDVFLRMEIRGELQDPGEMSIAV